MKESVLRMLKDNTGRYVSGESISEKLGVSRTAVWKYVTELRNDGYSIDSSPKKGYILKHAADILNAYEISYGLETSRIGRIIKYMDEVDSTNNEAKKMAADGCCDGTVVVAGRQFAGRGRLGRGWDSMNSKGIWMSVVLRPALPPHDIQVITLAASLAVVKAIKSVTGIDTGIKWPNDIILDGRKVCGILTEMSSEMDKINYVILGIGLNVNQDEGDFKGELEERAISLKIHAIKNGHGAFDRSNDALFERSSIIRAVLLELEKLCGKVENGNTDEIITEWKKMSVTLGKQVRIMLKNEECVGIATDITQNGCLVIKCSDGSVREVMSGEVSVRGIMGYV